MSLEIQRATQIISYWIICGKLCFSYKWSISSEISNVLIQSCSQHFLTILMTASSVIISPIFTHDIDSVLFFFLCQFCQRFANHLNVSKNPFLLVYFYMDSVFNFIDFCSCPHYIFPSAWVILHSQVFEARAQMINLKIFIF